MTDEAALADFARLLEEDFEGVIEKLRDPRGKVVLNADDLFRQCQAYHDDPQRRMRLGLILYRNARSAKRWLNTIDRTSVVW